MAVDYIPGFANPELWFKFIEKRPNNLRPGTSCNDHNWLVREYFDYKAFVEGLQPGADAEELRLQAMVKTSQAYLNESLSNKCGCINFAKKRLEYDLNKLDEYQMGSGKMADLWAVIDQFKEAV